jgi:hypothetical protein
MVRKNLPRPKCPPRPVNHVEGRGMEGSNARVGDEARVSSPTSEEAPSGVSSFLY